MKNAILSFLVVGFITLTACFSCDGPKGHYELNVVNNSTNDIYMYYGANYPDTTIKEYNPAVSSSSYLIKNKSSNSINNGDPIEFRFKEHRSDTIIFFLFDATIAKTIPWDSVMKNYLVLQRFDLSLEDLVRLNWTITYPPTDEMKNIHMFPPYKK